MSDRLRMRPMSELTEADLPVVAYDKNHDARVFRSILPSSWAGWHPLPPLIEYREPVLPTPGGSESCQTEMSDMLLEIMNAIETLAAMKESADKDAERYRSVRRSLISRREQQCIGGLMADYVVRLPVAEDGFICDTFDRSVDLLNLGK